MSEVPEVARITSELIRIDTTNHGQGRAVGEKFAAEYVRSFLRDLGISSSVYSAAESRTNLIARWAGSDQQLPPLLVHCHLDVVPADADRWTVDPFSGAIKDGMVWGRGAVDMKNMIGMTLSTIKHMFEHGEKPRRDILLAFFADEEAGCTLGSEWMVKNHPQVFKGVEVAISEVGGFSITAGSKRAYLIQTGEKGMAWIRLTANGDSAHGSMLRHESAIHTMVSALHRLQSQQWPTHLTETTRSMLSRISVLSGTESEPLDVVLSTTGASKDTLLASLRNVVNVTQVTAGYKENVIPESATATLDVRYLPGHRDTLMSALEEILGPGIDIQILVERPATENSTENRLVEEMTRSLRKNDPEATVVPYLMPASTDNKPLASLGIEGYGFVPLRLPDDLDFMGMFHGVDERVPINALVFGESVLRDLFKNY